MKMNIRIAGTEFSLKNKSYEIYIQGCYRNCKGCHNPDTHSFSGGKEVDIIRYLEDTYRKIYPFIKDGLIENIYISGGDLLCQDEEVAKQFSFETMFLFSPLARIWLFTGCSGSELPEWVWNYYDIVKAGTYQEDIRNPDGTFPASSNQVLLVNKKLSEEEFNNIEYMGVKLWSL